MAQQARDYITAAAPTEFEAIRAAFKVIDDPASHPSEWENLVFESIERPGRMFSILPSMHVIVWQPMGDVPSCYAVFYIGPASEWIA